ncbi:gfo/Idh/MocA family oxidoreductase [Verrucomicrobia bacterium LW23]|nr:gfo/Idh/MocA family oxidoreductase [Verrucomicrobia bacterium LW23]
MSDSAHPLTTRRRFLQSTAAAGAALVMARPGRAIANTLGDKEIRIALVGVGIQGRVLMDSVLKIPGIRFAALCDIWPYNLTAGERYVRKSGQPVNTYADVDEMLLKEKDLHAVLIATPDFWHAPHTNACLRAGLHVYCEKMMSNTVEGARSMVQTMRETGKLLQIGHQRRSNPRYIVALQRLIREAKLLGRITAANGQWNRAVGNDLSWPPRHALSGDVLARYGYESMNHFRNWRWYKKLGGGPLSDLGAHQIDIFTWFFGAPPRSILAAGGVDYYKNHEWIDNAMVIYEYETVDGIARAFYQVQTTTSAGGGYYEQFMGTEGTLKISENPSYTAIYREAGAPDWDQWVAKRYLTLARGGPAEGEDGETTVDARETAELATFKLPVVLNKAIHQPHLENFFQAIRGKAKLNCPGDEAFASEYAIYRTNDAIDARQMLHIRPEEYKV